MYSHTKDNQYRDLNLALAYAKAAVSLTNEGQPDYLDTLAEVYIQFEDVNSKRLALGLLKKAVLIAPNDRKSTFIADFRQSFPEEKVED